ncbi:MAG: DUF4166 domain-containing protein [Thermoflexales bacterium]
MQNAEVRKASARVSPFRAALGADFDTLAPELRRHYDLSVGQTLVIEGAMSAWNRLAFAQRLLSFMPVPGDGIPVRVGHRLIEDTDGAWGLEWRRRFDHPLRTFGSYTLTKPARRPGPYVIDFFNQPATFGLTLRLDIEEGGRALRMTSDGSQYAVLGRRLLPLPPGARLRVDALERVLDDGGLASEIGIRHPLFGRLFGYSGITRIGP